MMSTRSKHPGRPIQVWRQIILSMAPLFSICVPLAAQVAQPTTTTSQPDQARTPATAPADNREKDRKLGAYQTANTGLLDPTAVAVDADNRVYIAESGRHQIAVFDATGKRLRTIGRKGSGEGELLFPSGVAVAGNGDIYASDNGNHQIVVFDRNGKFLRGWGGFGSAAGQLIRPMGLAIAGDRIYVTDAGNDRVQVFDLGGDPMKSIGEWGTKPGQFQRPVAVAVDRAANLYVLDQDNNRVQVFDSTGKNPRVWGEWGPFPGMIAGARGFCLHENLLYIADTMNHRVQVMRPAGKAAYQWGIHAFMPREGGGKLHYPSAIAVAPTGEFAVVCEGFENRCQIFRRMPPGELPPTSPFVQNDPSGQSHFGISAGLSRNLVALSEEEIDQVSIHNLLDGAAVRIAMVGQHGVRPGQFVRPSGIDLDAGNSTLIVGDAGNRRLHEFQIKQDPPGQLRFIPQMASLTRTLDFAALRETTPELKDRPVIEPTIVRRDREGTFFILDAVQCLVVVLDKDYTVRKVWPTLENKPAWIQPADLVLDPAGRHVYIADAGAGVVRSYTRNGRPRDEWRDERLTTPGGVAVNSYGIVFVSDEFENRILKFDAEGKLIKSWGASGLGAGQLYRPRGMMLTEAGHLLVIDHGNHRCQIFSKDGKYLNVFGATYFIRPAQRGVNDATNQE